MKNLFRQKIIEHKTQSAWKIQLTKKINFISSKKDSDGTGNMGIKSNDIEVMIGSETDEDIEDLFKSLLQKYQEQLEDGGSNFIYDSLDILYYDLHKISVNRGGSYIDSPKWLKDKKATINLKNKDDRCFQYAVTIALNYQKIKNNPERISKKLKSFIDQYNWKKISFQSHQKDWKKFESNNKTIALNTLYVPCNTI